MKNIRYTLFTILVFVLFLSMAGFANAVTFNKWINPSENNSVVKGVVNVTVNITDTTGVDVSLINFNDSNFTMDRTGNLSYFVWDTNLNADGLYNIIIFFNSTLDGSFGTDTLFNIEVNNAIPGGGGVIAKKLIISDLDVKVDGKTDKNLKDGDKISKEAKPGSVIIFKIEVENLFTKKEDLEIEDINVEITIEDIDDGDDLDEDAKDFDLNPGKNDDVKITFDIPLEVDEGDYDVLIEIEGEDENGTIHEILYKLELEVEKEDHEIRIVRSALTPSVISCQRQISINTEIINTGTKDEDDVTLEIVSQELGISSLTTNIELDEGTDDNRLTKLITHFISDDFASGTYPIIIDVYYDNKLSESKTIDLTVGECKLVKEIKKEVEEEKPEVEVLMPSVTTEKKPVAGINGTLLAILIVLFLGTVVFVIGAGYIVSKK